MVPSFINSSVATDDPMVRIGRVDPYAMIVYMLVFFAGLFKGFPSVFGMMKPCVHAENFILVNGVTNDFLIIISGSLIVAHFAPACPSVGTSKKPAFFPRCFYNCIHIIHIGWRYCQSDSSQLSTRKAIRQFIPFVSSINCFVYGRLRPSINIGPDMPSSLVRCGEQYIRISRIHNDITNSGVFRNFKDFVPGFASIGSFKKTSISSGGPQRPICSYVHYVGVGRVNNDLSNVLRIFQSHVFE